jgi:hypothetical protein
VTDNYTTVLPSAGRLMTSLRDIGYELSSAIADLVDNSIDANARHVAIDVVADAADSWIRVSDDGIGMGPRQLEEAMRYGTHTEYASRALGQFGLGLKTASLSQCRRLTVASLGADARRRAARRWDLDRVIERDSWDLERVSVGAAGERLLVPLEGREQGTVVLWEKLDRLLPRRPTQGMTARVVRTGVTEIRQHLAMVFHRFLGGEAFAGRARLTITLNGETIEPWDPYSRDERHTRVLPSRVVAYEDSDGHTIAVAVSPYVLPEQRSFSSPEAHRHAGGPQRWNRHQGFYIYRRDRLLQAGGWNRLRTLDEHAKLARIAIDLPAGDEDRFAVDVAKMRVVIPAELRPELRVIASGAVAAAQERYRDHLAMEPSADADPRPATIDAIRISRDWPAIMAVVDDVLGEDPQLRDRLLLRLANVDPNDASLPTRDPRLLTDPHDAETIVPSGDGHDEGEPITRHRAGTTAPVCATQARPEVQSPSTA